MNVSEAIRHCEDKAKELRCKADFETEQGEIDICYECAREHEQLAEWLKELKDLRAFAKWVRGEVLDDEFEDTSGAFAEIACRKLVKLGYVELDGDVYKKKENDK